jgi:hypothetical protein
MPTSESGQYRWSVTYTFNNGVPQTESALRKDQTWARWGKVKQSGQARETFRSHISGLTKLLEASQSRSELVYI